MRWDGGVGKKLGDAVANAYLRNSDFRRAFLASRREGGQSGE